MNNVGAIIGAAVPDVGSSMASFDKSGVGTVMADRPRVKQKKASDDVVAADMVLVYMGGYLG